MPQKSIGLIEFKGLTGAVAAADAAARAADIELAACEVTTGACVVLRIEGDLVEVQRAIESATTVARKLGQFLTAKVIPRPHEGLAPFLATRGYNNPLTTPAAPGRIESKPAAAGPSEPKVAPVAASPRSTPRPEPKPTHSPAKAVAPAPPKTPPHSESSPAPTPESAKPQPKPVASALPDMAQLEKMPVVKLRQFARTVERLPIQGREISMANKAQLLDAIRQTLAG